MVKLVFVSGTTTGGSGRSQRELATSLVSRGHSVVFVVDDKRQAPVTRWLYARLSDLSVRAGDSFAGLLVAGVRDAIGRGVRDTVVGDLQHLTTAIPQNALPDVVRNLQPDVVVVNSVERWGWRLIHQLCAAQGVPTVLHVREMNSLRHPSVGVPDVLLANTKSLTYILEQEGFECEFVPSVVDLSITRTDSTRQKALAVNPDAMKGGDFIWEVARHARDIPIVVQEAWELSPQEISVIERRLAEHPNVEFRRRIPPGPSLYADARVLLAPYRVDSRPRVILEAQSNGIPVLGSDLPAIVDAVGRGGTTLSMDDPKQWAGALTALWQDDAEYARLCDAALDESRRPELDPEHVTSQFEDALVRAVQAQRKAR